VEPRSLAIGVVALLIAYMQQVASKLGDRTGETIAEAALPKVEALYQRVRARLGPATAQGALLDTMQDDPAGRRQQGLETELTRVISQDHKFAAELERLLDEVSAAGGLIAGTDTGVVAGGNVYQHAGGDVVGRDKISGDKVGRDKVSYAPPPPPER
jgi:hypothetical protein